MAFKFHATVRGGFPVKVTAEALGSVRIATQQIEIVDVSTLRNRSVAFLKLTLADLDSLARDARDYLEGEIFA